MNSGFISADGSSCGGRGIPVSAISRVCHQRAIEPDAPPAAWPIVRIEQHERARYTGRRGFTSPPRLEGIIRVRAGCPECGRSQAKDVPYLRGPEPAHHVGDRGEAASESDAIRNCGREIGSLRVVAADGLLQVREARPVFDVEECGPFHGPGDDIATAGELEVLIRLVDRNAEAEALKVAGLNVAHPGMHNVLARSRGRPSLIDKVQFRSHAQGDGDSSVGLD